MAETLYRDPDIVPIEHFADTRNAAGPNDRLRATVRAARLFHDELMHQPAVHFYRTFDLIRAPYPTRYGLRDACKLPIPYVHIVNRLCVVQYRSHDGTIRTLLSEPLDRLGNAETPFFKRLAKRVGGTESLLARTLWPVVNDVLDALRSIGIRPQDVDYITYDHLHTQDLRGWLGTNERAAIFPNAKLLVMRQEWESARALLPSQREWYPPQGTQGIPDDRLVLIDHDVMIGSSIALVRTPGHTEGNHSLVVRVPDGVLVSSENGIAADAYAPEHSRIPGLRSYARDTGMEIVLNGNTLEGAIDQYISMVQEREIAGRWVQNPEFYGVVPSSELTKHWLSPGVRPTHFFGELCYGEPYCRA